MLAKALGGQGKITEAEVILREALQIEWDANRDERPVYAVRLDLSRNCSASLTWYFAEKEKRHGITDTHTRISR